VPWLQLWQEVRKRRTRTNDGMESFALLVVESVTLIILGGHRVCS
jgi:hypothetical protein